VVNRLKRAEGVDVYDTDTDFNPFGKERSQTDAVAVDAEVETAVTVR